MDEHSPHQHGDDVTGHPAVDEVLASLPGLDPRDVETHVGVFERAHEQLRRALADAGEEREPA